MKNLLVLSLILCLLLSGCGGKANSSGASSAAPANSDSAEVRSQADAAATTASSESQDSVTGSFEDGKLTTDDYDITITYWTIIRPGEGGNENGSDPVLTFWYDTKNHTDKALTAPDAWQEVFTAVQDNNPNYVNHLKMSPLPDNDFEASQKAAIKKDGTIANAVGYILSDLETPVVLTAAVSGTDIGSCEFDIKECAENLDVREKDPDPSSGREYEVAGLKFRLPSYIDTEKEVENGLSFYKAAEYTSYAVAFYDIGIIQEGGTAISPQEMDRRIVSLQEKSINENNAEITDQLIYDEKGLHINIYTETRPDFKSRRAYLRKPDGSILFILCGYDPLDHSHYDYIGDCDDMIRAMEVPDAPAAENAEEPSGEAAPKEAASEEAGNQQAETESPAPSGIRPEFKAAMDSYEAFFDSYVEFMKNYDASDLTMLAKYMDFMTKYAETMEKLEEIDENELSTEEAVYYTDTMLRINKKILEAM